MVREEGDKVMGYTFGKQFKQDYLQRQGPCTVLFLKVDQTSIAKESLHVFANFAYICLLVFQYAFFRLKHDHISTTVQKLKVYSLFNIKPHRISHYSLKFSHFTHGKIILTFPLSPQRPIIFIRSRSMKIHQSK